MKLNIFAKLFFAVLLATLVVIVFMVVFMNWSFQRGFADYQHNADVASVTVLAGALAEDYRTQTDWNFLRNKPRNWQAILLNLMSEAPALRSLSGRIRLRDAAGELVIGTAVDNPEATAVAVVVEGRLVGQLELDRQEIITDELAGSFLQQQARNVYLIALFATLLSLLVAGVVVRQLLIPVRKLTDGAKTLAQGDFSTHIAVSTGDELGELASRFNQLAEFLQQNEELRAQWIADISHELRTPLAVLRSEIEALLDGVRQPTLERIRSLHADTLSLSKLVDDLYQLSLSDAGDMELPDEQLDLAVLLEDVLDAFEARLLEKQIRLQRDWPDETFRLRGDDKRLYQLFSNLLENSYRYTDPGGLVRVSLRRVGAQVQIRVADSAPGVPDAALPRLFERLFRVDKSRSRAQGGSGLGLSICKNIVKLHQGEISAEHAPEGGLAVQVCLPLSVKKSHG
ncbi:MAG: ATP-binding protein [Thiolinea sp.]